MKPLILTEENHDLPLARAQLTFRVGAAYQARTEWHRRLPADPPAGGEPAGGKSEMTS